MITHIFEHSQGNFRLEHTITRDFLGVTHTHAQTNTMLHKFVQILEIFSKKHRYAYQHSRVYELIVIGTESGSA